MMGLEHLESFFLQAVREGGSQYLVYSRYPHVVEMLESFIMCFWIAVDSMAWRGEQ